MVPAMCPGSVPVLCMCPDRRLGRRRPRSHPRQTTKTSLMPFFGRRRRRQVRTQSLSEPRSGSVKCEIHANTPKSQCSASHRAALRFTLALALASLDLDLCLGRPFAAKTNSQPASRESRQRPSPQTAGEGPLPGGGRPPQHPTRRHQREQPAFAQSQQELNHRTAAKD